MSPDLRALLVRRRFPSLELLILLYIDREGSATPHELLNEADILGAGPDRVGHYAPASVTNALTRLFRAKVLTRERTWAKTYRYRIS